MAYLPNFDEIVKAIQSLKIFTDTIKEFTELLKQRYLRKHSTKEIVWINELCGVYQDNCYNYVKFIKRVIGEQFLANCLSVEDDSERRRMIKELKANTVGANDRLDRFLGETTKTEVLEKVGGVLSEMEEVQARKEKKDKYYQKFSEWLKGKVIAQVGEMFAKVVGPLWDFVYTNATLAVKSDYDHETLKKAVSTIEKFVPQMNESIEANRNALKGLEAVLDVLEKEEEEELKKNLRPLYTAENRVEVACMEIMKHVDALSE